MNVHNKLANLFDLIERGNVNLIRELINSEYDINARIADGLTPIMLAANLGSLDIVKYYWNQMLILILKIITEIQLCL
ncbi:ankyrin repeat domain-containing protein [Crocosphaera chwakensis]|uniref:Uncharacterized protein n=1 Tax=Crocosphaera chwakensis CCY0110 TaxID=391612 RepID=A3IQC9_9CHRO|nr:ankyrin repeat domain-containing protein [Crocosphaera chwakensis]EAZ91469.1 hypothetical protein CY0110_05847 [Crocosphaera chwakensis CCY0110]